MKIKIPVIFTCLLIVAGCATKRDVIQLDKRFTLLRVRTASIEKKLSQMGQVDAKIEDLDNLAKENTKELRIKYAKLKLDIQNLRGEIQELNGKIDETNYLLKRKFKISTTSGKNERTLLSKLDQQIKANSDKLNYIQQYLDVDTIKPAGKATNNIPETQIAPLQKPTKELGERALYKLGKQKFDTNDLESSRDYFKKLLKKFPKSQMADNALFWIGESYYKEKWYEKAILEYEKAINKYPKGNKVPAAKLKQALAFKNLGDIANARTVLKELIQKYPKSTEAKIAKRKLKDIAN